MNVPPSHLVKRLGFAAFAFFLVKGLVWLALGASAIIAATR